MVKGQSTYSYIANGQMVSGLCHKYPTLRRSLSPILQGRLPHTSRYGHCSRHVLSRCHCPNGGWKLFTEAHQKIYGTHLPFYLLTDNYVPDEINPEDIAFVLWTLKSQPGSPNQNYTLFSPYDKELLALSQTVYKLMDARFEEAPIREEASSCLWVTGTDLPDMPITPLPEVTPETKLSNLASRCLEYSKGKPLLYFTNYKELCVFFVDILKWENKPSATATRLGA